MRLLCWFLGHRWQCAIAEMIRRGVTVEPAQPFEVCRRCGVKKP